jgi:hypothetical protein
LDLTACITLDALGVLRDGTLSHRKLAIAQSTLDELRAEISLSRTHPPEGFMSLGLHEGQLVRFDVTADEVKARQERFESLSAWLKTNAAVIPVSPSVAEKHADKASLADFLGRSFWDSLLISSEHGRALVSDDLRLRQLLQGDFGGAGICSPLLLLAEANSGRMSGERYGDCVVNLITAGYRHISTDARVLQAAARMEQWRPQGRLLRVLDTIKGPAIEPASAAAVAAQFFRMLWFDVVLPQQREMLSFAVLDALCTGRPVGSVMPAFIAHVQNAFAMLPFADAAAKRTVAAWQRLRVGT